HQRSPHARARRPRPLPRGRAPPPGAARALRLPDRRHAGRSTGGVPDPDPRAHGEEALLPRGGPRGDPTRPRLPLITEAAHARRRHTPVVSTRGFAVHLDARLVRRVFGCLEASPLIEFTRDLARIPSVFGSERTLAEAAARRMDALGFEVQTVDVEKDRPNVLGWVKGSGGGPSLMFNGHTDTVVQSLGWTKPLYGGDLEDGRIYGHGVSNMKASDAAMIYAADAIRRAGVKLKGDLLIALVVGECQGGIGTRDLMARGVRTDTFLCAEPTDFGILTLHAASQYLRVAVTGRTGHPGAYDRGLSAVQKMLELTTRLGPMHEAMRPGGWMT